MSNPALSNNPALNGKTLTADELRRIYEQPAAQTQRPGIDVPAEAAGAQVPPTIAPSDKPMTYENTISKTVLLFVIVLAGGAAGWVLTPSFPLLPIVGALAGLVLGLVNAFKKEPNVGLIVAYAAAQGLFLGGISMMLEYRFNGIVSQAVIATLAVFGVTLLLFRSGKVRTSPKMTKIVLIAMVGYGVFSLVNFGMVMFGATDNPWGMRAGWVGVAIGLLAVFLAAYSLVMDFELIQNGVRNRVPEKWGWSAAFGLTVTLVWLYLELLRIIAILRGGE